MQQYIRTKCNEIDSRYNQQEYALRSEKDKDCQGYLGNKAQLIRANDKRRKILLIIAEIAAVIAGSLCFELMQNGVAFFVLVGLCIAAYCVVNKTFREQEKQIELSIQKQIDSREQQLSRDIQQLEAKKTQDKKKLQADINNTMNQYRRTFEQSKASVFLVEWITNALSNEIAKADRSKWFAQVKATLRFVVDCDFIEIPGFGKYDMKSQGIYIDNNPMAIGALAYVLEKMTIAEAQRKFPIDPNGGRAVFTSTRNDTHVEIQYSAPNGGAQTTR